MLDCLEELSVPHEQNPKCNYIVVDGMVMINMLVPDNLSEKTFNDWSVKRVVSNLRVLLDGASRLDVVNDVHKENSLKSHTRGTRGTGVRIHIINGSTKLQRDWKSFLRNDYNKTKLISYLADEVTTEMRDDENTIIFTTNEEVRSVPERDNTALEPCDQEEADSRMFLHIADAAAQGNTTFMIRTNDTDVVVLSVVYASKKNLDIQVSFGTGKNHRYINSQEIARKLGEDKCRALVVIQRLSLEVKERKPAGQPVRHTLKLTPILINLTESLSDPSELSL